MEIRTTNKNVLLYLKKVAVHAELFMNKLLWLKIVYVKNGYRVEAIRCDRVCEYRFNKDKKFCRNNGMILETFRAYEL